MSFLADIHTYIAGNATITAVLPAASIYTGLIPEGTAFPYAVITPIGLTPSPTTGSGYYEAFSFQISIFDTDPDNVEALANTVGGQFDYKTISSSAISCERTNGPVFTVDPDSPQRTYHALLEYQLLANRTLPNVN
jgi:hypothetical protein